MLGSSPLEPLLGATATWPVIGRERELATIARARADGAGGVVVYAPAGVGKSRVAREALTEAERQGALTAWVQATRSAASMPLGAFAGVIPLEVRSDNLFELLRRGTEAMRELAGARDLVVGVDDGQLLDPISAALVLHLVSSAAAFVVATVRSDEPCPDAIVTLWKDRLVPRVELQRLDQAQTERLAETILDGPAEEAIRQWVWETSRGNAMYVRELLLGALGAGALTQVGGLWRMPTRPPISSSLVESISARLEGLGPGEHRALELLALGEPLLVAEMVAIAGREPLAAVEVQGLISVAGDRGGALEVRLAHPMYGEVIRARLGAFGAHEIRVELANLVQSRSALTPDTSLRVARWLLDAGEPVPTATLVDAARAANLNGDPELGAELAQLAVQAGAGVEASLILARSHTIRKRFEDAEAVLAGTEVEIDRPETALIYLEQRISALYWGLRRVAAIEELMDRAASWWPDKDWQIQLAPLRLRAGLFSLGSTGDPSAILAESTELVQTGTIDAGIRSRLESVQLSGLYRTGRGREAQALARRIRPSPPLRDSDAESTFAVCVGIATDTGEGLREIDEWAPATLQQAVRLGDRTAAGLAAYAIGHRRLLEGRHADAARWLAEAQLQFEQHDAHGVLAIVLAMQTSVAADRHDPAAAEAALAGCRAALGAEPALPIQARYLVCAQAWAATAAGDRTRAQEILLDAAREFSGFPMYAVRLLYEAMRCGAPAGAIAPGLSAINERCDASLVAAKAAHATHLAARDAQALLTTVDEFERIGAPLYATEAAAQAASLSADAGREDSARRAATRRNELFVDGQGRPLPPIPALDGQVELTPREAQILQLAGQGLTHRQIAERLVVSVRTVESHLYHARQKLGTGEAP